MDSSDEYLHEHALKMATVAFESDSYDTQGLNAEQYSGSVKRVLNSQIHHLRAPFAEWRKSARLLYEKKTQQRLRMVAWFFGSAASVAIANILFRGAAITFFPKHLSKVVLPYVGVLNLIIAVVILSIWIVEGPHRASRQASKAYYLLEDQYSDLVRNLVLQPAVSAAFEVVWLDSSLDEVRVQDGPKLSSKAGRKHIVATSAYNRVAVALTRQNGCAVGVAGPRGSGKTELARSFTELYESDSRNRIIPLFLWAPAKDDADTFMLRMLKELCINIVSTVSGTSGDYEPAAHIIKRRRRIVTALVMTALIGLGTAVLIIDLMGVSLRATAPLIAGSILIWVGLGIGLWSLSSRPQRSASIDISKSTLELAATLRSQVDFTETLKTNSQIGISTYGLHFSAGQDAELVRTPLNDVDVIREIRTLTQAVSHDGWEVIIAIDEMDKMPDEEAATRFLNHIKVLFPIAGCSFIVSVSEMAWSLFERRGLPFRDVLDSSFDEIIYLGALAATESRDILKRRDLTISDPQILLCHCLSGGLPRDLLRWARILARTAAENSPPSALGAARLDEVLDLLLEEDLNVKVQAAKADIKANQTPRSLRAGKEALQSWLLIWTDRNATERTLIQSWSSLWGNQDTEDGWYTADILAYIAVLHTIREAFAAGGPLSKLTDETDFHSVIICNGFECIAQARGMLSRDARESWMLLERARSVLGFKPLSP
jgi:Cdc6-like AAA superfamily ATPase